MASRGILGPKWLCYLFTGGKWKPFLAITATFIALITDGHFFQGREHLHQPGDKLMNKIGISLRQPFTAPRALLYGMNTDLGSDNRIRHVKKEKREIFFFVRELLSFTIKGGLAGGGR